MKLSLVICTRNRAQQLAAMLKTVDRLTTQHAWELVLVDNGSTDKTQEVMSRYDSSVPKRIVIEPRPGSGRARNAGWKVARGEVVVFTDDDCYPDPDFLSSMAKAFDENPKLGFVGGRVLLFDPADYPITIQTSEDRLDIQPGDFIPAGRIHGASMGFRRAALLEVGGFDDRFGVGESFVCEDVDMQAHVLAAGWYGAYDPRPIVYHHHKRKTREEAARLMRTYDRGRGAYYAKWILNARTRTVFLKNWLLAMRYQPVGTTLRELRAAAEFMIRSSVDRATDRRPPQSMRGAHHAAAGFPFPGDGFREVSSTSTSLASIVRDFWQARYLLGQLARRDIRIRYTQAAMGFAWALLMPILTVLSGAIVRYILSKTSGTPFHGSDIPGVAVKAVVWGFFVGAMSFGVSSLVANMSLLTKVAFPREVLPLSSIAAQMFDSAIAAVAVALIIPFFGAIGSVQLLWIPLLVVLAVAWTTGLVMLLSCANLFFRDVKYLVQVILMFGVFFTPVFFEPAMLGRTGADLLMLNPLSGPMEGLRLVIMEGRNLASPLYAADGSTPVWNPLWLVWSAVASTVTLLISIKAFRRFSHLFAERA